MTSCFTSKKGTNMFRKSPRPPPKTSPLRNEKSETKVETKVNPDGSVTTTSHRIINLPKQNSQTKVEKKFPPTKPKNSFGGVSNSEISKLKFLGADHKPVVAVEVPKEKEEGKRIFGPTGSKGRKFKEVEKEGDPKKKIPDNVQDYERIKSQLAGTGKLFEDNEFPASDSSIFYSAANQMDVIWKRPGELVEKPQFFVGGVSRFDVNQGQLGNCWFLAAVADLTMDPFMFYRVVPKDNSFDDNYCGVFHFRFWQFGRWVDIVIDDRLPCNLDGQLVYMNSKEETEFWSALLEKAYAKLAGSYEALIGGTTSEALQDFSGGLVESIDLKTIKSDVFNLIETSFHRKAFMGCSIKSDPRVIEAKTDVGLIRGHAYSVTDVAKVNVTTPKKTGAISLVRVRNPWGNAIEWTGAWSDGSPQWQLVPEETREKLNVAFADDGEFWMSIKDFKTYFDTLEIVNRAPESFKPGTELPSGKHWSTCFFEGSWVSGATAGGCTNYITVNPMTYSHNPQYIVQLRGEEVGKKCLSLVALMQKNRRSQRKAGVKAHPIGYAIYELEEKMEDLPSPLDTKYFMFHKRLTDSGDFIPLREACGRFDLIVGKTYCIIPTTFDPNEEAEFLLRIFSDSEIHIEEHSSDVDFGQVHEEAEEGHKVEEQKTTDSVELLYKVIASDREEIGWKQLKQLLHELFLKEYQYDGGLSPEVCRSLIGLVDSERIGKVDLDGVKDIWKNVLRYLSVFKLFDEDASWTLNTFELRRALTAAGYKINNKIITAVVLRYGDEDGSVAFEDFLMCSIKLKSMIAAFKEKDTEDKKEATFTLSEWVELNICT